MMVTPYLFDQNLLLALNFDGGPVMDQVMYVVSGKLTWVPFYLWVLWLVWRVRGWRELLFFAGAIALVILCADQTASLFKAAMPKFRPSHFPQIMADVHTVNGYVGGLYGTVSSHAANSFGLALLASLVVRRRWFTGIMFGWALLVAYSRMYLGVHYPMDLLFGALEGLFWAAVWYSVMRWGQCRVGGSWRADY